MNIRNRLIMAFITIIGLPILLIAATTGTILYYTVSSVNKNYDVKTTTSQIFTNPNYLVIDAINSLYENLMEEMEDSPDKLLERQYAQEVNRKLMKKSSFLVVMKEDTPVYIGNIKRYKEIIEQINGIPRYSATDNSGLYFDDNQPFIMRKANFTYEDGTPGSISIFTNLETFLPQVKHSLMHLSICILGIIVFAAFFLIVWLYQSMIRPLNLLRDGIYRMKNGDLEFEMQTESDDEIGRICDDFEDMRKQVKEIMEERMEYEEQMKMFISNISHDLKTPITAIKGYAEGIMDGVADSPEKLDKYLKTIYAKANDMIYLVDELSFYSKIDTNKIPYNYIQVNLGQFFSDCMEELEFELEVKGIRLSFYNEVNKDVQVLIDVEQIKRVISNIVGNSVKYMDKPEGRILVRLNQENEVIIISFQDNGKGVAKSDLKKIFERFYRTDKSRNLAKPGSGLGLAIAKKIIEEHGGSIWAEGEEGKGLNILFTLNVFRDMKEDNYYVIEKDGKKVRSKVKN